MFNCADIPEIQNLWQTKSGSTPGFGREHLVTTDTEAVLFMLHLSVQPFSHMCCICVFVYLCIFVFVYLCKDRGTPRQPFSICWTHPSVASQPNSSICFWYFYLFLYFLHACFCLNLFPIFGVNHLKHAARQTFRFTSTPLEFFSTPLECLNISNPSYPTLQCS